MLKMIEAYHSEDRLPLFIVEKMAGQKGLISSDGLISDELVAWPEEMVDCFVDISNEMSVGEIASYNMCVSECLFCDTLRERLQQT